MGNILQLAHSYNVTSLALPAIGTGAGGVPPHLVATIIVDELQNFSSVYPYTTLRDIRVVLFEKSDHIVKVRRD